MIKVSISTDKESASLIRLDRGLNVNVPYYQIEINGGAGRRVVDLSYEEMNCFVQCMKMMFKVELP